jgi:hypothetical protein
MEPGMRIQALAVYIIFGFIVFSLAHCSRLNGHSFVPGVEGYKGNATEMTILKRPLREISGIDYISEDTLVAINDESGKIFFLNPINGDYHSFEFGQKGDYEDLVKAGNDYYVLNSRGELRQVNGQTIRQESTYKNDFGKGVEFESLYYDAAQNALVLICKECGRDAVGINAWVFNLVTKQFDEAPFFTIRWSEIRALAKDNSIECKPSAAAINPVTKKLYVIASVGKVLLECSLQGKLEKVYGINPDHFQQPEGITFSPNGDMYISNEGVQGKATLLTFKYLIP